MAEATARRLPCSSVLAANGSPRRVKKSVERFSTFIFDSIAQGRGKGKVVIQRQPDSQVIEKGKMNEQVKIRFNLHGNPVGGETVWAESLGNDLYRLLNVPYHAMGYAENDIVRCIQQDDWAEVIEVEQHSGNGTVRIMFADSNSSKAQHILKELVSVGCTYERASSKLVSVTVPPTLDVPFSQMANYLNSINEKVILGWEIGKNPTQTSK